MLDYTHTDEATYNKAVAGKDSNFICMDKTAIRLHGESSIEPCDLYRVENNTGVFYHVKRSTTSSLLSHLFNQGANSMQLLKLEHSAKNKFIESIRKVRSENHSHHIYPIEKGSFKVVYIIITPKQKSKKSKNLPLFSRISLKRSFEAFKSWQVQASFSFVKDASRNLN